MNLSLMNSKLNNRGLSLVELIVALSIGTVVAGSIAALMTFAIRQYRNESVNTEMQYELQSNINMIMDEIMGAQSVIVVQNSPTSVSAGNLLYTKYALFGKFSTSGTKYNFSGVIFASSSKGSDDKFKIFMDRISGAEGSSPIDIAQKCYGAISAGGTKYLLGENATRFMIMPNSLDEINHTYTNPISIKVELQFEKNGWGGRNYSKHVSDIVYLRNKVSDVSSGAGSKESVYVNTKGTESTEADYTAYRIIKKD